MERAPYAYSSCRAHLLTAHAHVQLDIQARLDSRRRATPAEFVAAMALQARTYRLEPLLGSWCMQ